jgi:triacylglycerol lipase
MEIRRRGFVLGVVSGLAALVLAGPAAADPALRVSKRKLNRALHCQPQVRNARTEPVLLVTGTGAKGTDNWTSGPDFQATLRRAGHPSCYLNFPRFTTGDIKTAAEYVVNGIRVMRRGAGRRIGVYGISQGALMPRWALTYWPRLRRQVADVVAVAGTQHGTTGGIVSVLVDSTCRPTAVGCAPAFWQQAIGSHLLKALNSRADETPGRRTAWTTVRSLSDELVQPQLGPYPTSSLFGARNVLIQRVCPGRTTSHFAAVYDSVSYAALIDALRHRGGAKPSRFPRDVCSHPYGTGLDPTTTKAVIDTAFAVIYNRVLRLPRVKAEPPVRRYARIRR